TRYLSCCGAYFRDLNGRAAAVGCDCVCRGCRGSMTVTPMSPPLMLEAALLEDGDSEEVMGGVYGPVDDAATMYMPLVGAVADATATVADAWRLPRSDWKLDWADAETVA